MSNDTQRRWNVLELHASTVMPKPKTKMKTSWKLNFPWSALTHTQQHMQRFGDANAKRAVCYRQRDKWNFLLGLRWNTSSEWANKFSYCKRSTFVKDSDPMQTEHISMAVNLSAWRVKIWQWINEYDVYLYIKYVSKSAHRKQHGQMASMRPNKPEIEFTSMDGRICLWPLTWIK